VFYYLVFGALAAIVAALELAKSGKDRVATSPAFNSFKNNYILVYSLMMCTPPDSCLVPSLALPRIPVASRHCALQIWTGGAMPVVFGGLVSDVIVLRRMVQLGTGCRGPTCTTSTASTASTRATLAASSSPASVPPCSSAPSSDPSRISSALRPPPPWG
jgi:hypothetical protein